MCVCLRLFHTNFCFSIHSVPLWWWSHRVKLKWQTIARVCKKKAGLCLSYLVHLFIRQFCVVPGIRYNRMSWKRPLGRVVTDDDLGTRFGYCCTSLFIALLYVRVCVCVCVFVYIYILIFIRPTLISVANRCFTIVLGQLCESFWTAIEKKKTHVQIEDKLNLKDW